MLNEKIRDQGINVVIEVPAKEINYAVGYKSENKTMLKQRFDSVNFLINSNLAGRNFNVIYN